MHSEKHDSDAENSFQNLVFYQKFYNMSDFEKKKQMKTCKILKQEL